MKNFRYAEIYTGVPKGEKPDINKDWHVYYFFVVPDSNPSKWKRFQVKDGINRIKDLKERLDYGKSLVRTIDRSLDKGYNPFSVAPAFLSIENAIKLSLTKKRWSRETKDIHSGIIRIFKEALGERTKSDVKLFSRPDARDILDKMVENQKVGDKSWNRFRTSLHGIFDALKEYEKIKDNPFDFKNRKVPKRDKPNLITPEQGKMIKDHLLEHRPGFYVFLLTMNMTTIRPSEILKIKAEDIEIKTYEENDIKKEMWYINLFAENVKDRESRKVVVPVHLRSFLKPHLLPGHYLFGDQCNPQVRKSPKSWKTVYKMWTKWVVEDCKITGIKPYSFKHLGIKSMLVTMPDKAVQYQAGHSTSSMTDIYSGKDATIFEKELEKFEGDL